MKFLLIILYFLVSIVQVNAQSIYDSASSYHFIHWLYNEREYDLFVTEARKYIEAYPDDDTIKLKLIHYYQINDQQDSALYYFKHYFSSTSEKNKKQLLRLLHLLTLNNNPEEIKRGINNSLLDESEKEIFYMSLLILERKWDYVKHHYDSVSDKHYQVKQLEPVISEIKKPYKYPFLATTMSTILPGAGKVYVGRRKDGFNAFILVGIFTWQSYVGFKKRGVESIYGWINGGLASGFYLGNIYGSYKAARDYNKRKDETIYRSLYNYHKYTVY